MSWFENQLFGYQIVASGWHWTLNLSTTHKKSVGGHEFVNLTVYRLSDVGIVYLIF